MILQNFKSEAIFIPEQFLQNIKLTLCQTIDLYLFLEIHIRSAVSDI